MARDAPEVRGSLSHRPWMAGDPGHTVDSDGKRYARARTRFLRKLDAVGFLPCTTPLRRRLLDHTLDTLALCFPAGAYVLRSYQLHPRCEGPRPTLEELGAELGCSWRTVHRLLAGEGLDPGIECWFVAVFELYRQAELLLPGAGAARVRQSFQPGLCGAEGVLFQRFPVTLLMLWLDALAGGAAHLGDELIWLHEVAASTDEPSSTPCDPPVDGHAVAWPSLGVAPLERCRLEGLLGRLGHARTTTERALFLLVSCHFFAGLDKTSPKLIDPSPWRLMLDALDACYTTRRGSAAATPHVGRADVQGLATRLPWVLRVGTPATRLQPRPGVLLVAMNTYLESPRLHATTWHATWAPSGRSTLPLEAARRFLVI